MDVVFAIKDATMAQAFLDAFGRELELADFTASSEHAGRTDEGY